MTSATLSQDRYAVYDLPAVRRELVGAHADGRSEIALSLPTLHCGGCVRRCERVLAALGAVDQVQVNLATRRASVVWDADRLPPSGLLAALEDAGFPAYPYDPQRREADQRRQRRQMLRRLAVAGFAAMQVMMFSVALYAGDHFDLDIDAASRQFLRWMSLLLTLPVVLYSARPFFANALAGLRRGRLVMDLPVSLAIGVAFVAGARATLFDPAAEVYFDSACMFTFLLLLGRFLELGARQRAAAADDELDRLTPAVAERLGVDGASHTVAVAELAPGDRVLVRPGATVPADGRVVDGASSVDESLLSGESRPRGKRPGSAVVGGSVNVDSPLTVTVERVGQDTVMAAMRRLLARAQQEKPRLAQLADRVAGGFVAALLLLAAATYLYWLRQAPDEALRVTLAVLVVSCPCALSLATPAALAVATGALARLGLLAGRGHALETLARADRVVLDKTGTLTYGAPRLDRVETLGPLTEARCLALAAALERDSEHPLAKALRAVAGDAGPVTVSGQRATPGGGVEATITGRRYRLGSLRYVQRLTGEPLPEADRLDPQSTVVALGTDHGWLALFYFSDRPRADAAAAVAELHGLGLECEILSGDRPGAVAAVAAKLGVATFRGDASPADKLDRVTALQNGGAVVVAVGDGVNDSPLLARAQVSVAIAEGTDLARASADLTLLHGRLTALADGVRLARRALRVIRQNLGWALAYNLAALPLAAAGLIAPWLAALGMSASSLIVVLNALRLGRPARR